MTRVFVGIGSNIDALENIGRALHALRIDFHNVIPSNGYENPSDGFVGNHFINAVVLFNTTLSIQEVLRKLHRVELDLGKDLSSGRYTSKTIDLDLLYFGDLQIKNDRITLPRPEATTKSYYLKPLSEIAPDWIDPVAKTTVATLWDKFTGTRKLRTVSIKEVALDTTASTLTVDALECMVHLGVPKDERAKRQAILISWKIIFTITPNAITSDEIRDTPDYGVMARTLKGLIEDHEFRTIEYLAAFSFENIANYLEPDTLLSVNIRKFPLIDGLKEGVCFTLEGHV